VGRSPRQARLRCTRGALPTWLIVCASARAVLEGTSPRPLQPWVFFRAKTVLTCVFALCMNSHDENEFAKQVVDVAYEIHTTTSGYAAPMRGSL